MYPVRPPLIARPLLGEALWRVATDEHILYLTFDDGPVPGVTDAALDILERYNARATFFCLGKQVETHPELYRSIADRGHRTGNHTWDHPSGWKTPNSQYFANVEQCAALVDSSLFRPPYGRIQRSQVKELAQQYTVVMWDVLSGDFDAGNTGDKCAQNVIKHSRPGSIVVFHDSLKAGSNMLSALPIVLEHFSKAGYRFEVLP